MSNALNLSNALDYLRDAISSRMKLHLGQENEIEIEMPSFFKDDSAFTKFIQTHQPTFDEYIILLLALVPHIQAQFLNKIIEEHLPQGGDFPEFGSIKSSGFRGILPTGETAQFILAGNDIEKRIEIQKLFTSDHWFARQHILWLEAVRDGEPSMSGRLILDPEIIE